MKDIDFDELDKAVNSLMTRAQSKEPVDTPTSPDTASALNALPRTGAGIPTTAAPISPGTIKPKSALATNPDAQPAITPQPRKSMTTNPLTSRSGTPAARRSGRFMDVVPAAAKKADTSPRPVSREGGVITPRSSDTTASQPETPSRPQQDGTSSQPVMSSTSTMTEKAAPKSDWPDPLEFHAKRNETPGETSPQPAQESPIKPPVVQESEPSEEPAKDQPLSSPFLPDAKVEKRPLGAPMPSAAMASEPLPKMPTPDDSAAQLSAQPSDTPSEPPEEFRGDLMRVEADTHMGLPKTDDLHDEKADEIIPGPIVAPAKLLEDHSRPVDGETDKTDGVGGRISIPQQYKEQPSSGEKESGAIYDTDTYHQPLAHPVKKKSGWLWVLWIVLILVVGAGIGVALYFLGVM